MAVSQILLVIAFFFSYVSASPLPQGNCGSTTGTCCRRSHGAPEPPVQCVGTVTTDYGAHQGFDPEDIWGQGPEPVVIHTYIGMQAATGTVSLGRIELGLHAPSNRFRLTFGVDTWGPGQVVRHLQATFDSRVQGLAVRIAIFRIQQGRNVFDPTQWELRRPSTLLNADPSGQAFAEMTLLGHVTHSNTPNMFYNTRDFPRSGYSFRWYWSVFVTDIDGNYLRPR